MPEPKSNYEQRLEDCIHKSLLGNADSAYWRIAAEVYEHLIKCPFTHHGANATCPWQSGDNGTQNGEPK